MRAKIAIALGFVLLAVIVWLVTRKKQATTPSEPAIISSLVTTSAPSTAPPPVDAGPTYTGGFCEAMDRASHVAITRGSKLAGHVLEEIVPACVDGDRGGWAVRVDDVFAVPSGTAGEIDIGFEAVLVHRDANGALATYVLPHDTWHPDGGPVLEVAVTRILYYGSRSIHQLIVGDIDGDRDPEAFLQGGIHEEGPDPGWTQLLTFKDGMIRAYPTNDIAVAGVEDVDHDGRLDVLTPGPYDGVMASSQIGSDWPAVGGVFVAHALADGGFSMTDTVAKSALLKQCPKKEPVTLTPDWIEPEGASKQILCARAWGASEADVRKQMSARCPVYEDAPMDVAHCPSVLLDAAKIAPGVTLP